MAFHCPSTVRYASRPWPSTVLPLSGMRLGRGLPLAFHYPRHVSAVAFQRLGPEEPGKVVSGRAVQPVPVSGVALGRDGRRVAQ